MPEPQPQAARGELRLLLATIAISVGMLLLLARFRFPEEAGRQAPAEHIPAPLERLAARATFDELAGIMGDLDRRVSQTVLPLGVQGESGVTYVPAVRLTEDRAVAVLPPDRRVIGVGSEGAPSIVARDAARDLIVVQAPTNPDAVVTFPSAPARPGPRYVAVVEATARASAVRPVYVGRTDLFADPRWSEPLLSVAAVQQTLSVGSAVFALDGTFVGLAGESAGTITLIPANLLRNVVTGAPSPFQGRGDLAVQVEPLNTRLARAAGADKGVMVSYVPPSIGDRSDLAPGDVVQAIDGIGITTVAGFQQVAQSRTPGAQVALDIVRRGKPHHVTITARESGAQHTWEAAGRHGAILRSIPGTGAEVLLVEPGSPSDRAGLRRGDVIVAVDTLEAPDGPRIDRLFASARQGDALLMTIRRDADHRVLVLERP